MTAAFLLVLSAVPYGALGEPELARLSALRAPVCGAPCETAQPRVWRDPYRPDEAWPEPKPPLLQMEPYRGEVVLQTIGPYE